MVFPSLTIPQIIRSDVREHLQRGRSPKWDYATGEFLLADRRFVVDRDCTFDQIVHNALLTQRGLYPIFNFDYGSDLDKLIGYDPDYVRARIPGMIREALNDPRVGSIDISDIVLRDDGGASFVARVRDRLTQNLSNVREEIPFDKTLQPRVFEE